MINFFFFFLSTWDAARDEKQSVKTKAWEPDVIQIVARFKPHGTCVSNAYFKDGFVKLFGKSWAGFFFF